MMNEMDGMGQMGGMVEQDPMAQDPMSQMAPMGPDPLLMELMQRALSPEVDSQNYPSDMDPQLLELLRGVAPMLGMGMPMDPMMDMGMDPGMGGDPMAGMPPEGMEEGGEVPSVTPPQPPPPPTPMAQPPQGPPGAMMPPVSLSMPQNPGEMPDPALMEQLMMRQMGGQQEPPPEY